MVAYDVAAGDYVLSASLDDGDGTIDGRQQLLHVDVPTTSVTVPLKAIGYLSVNWTINGSATFCPTGAVMPASEVTVDAMASGRVVSTSGPIDCRARNVVLMIPVGAASISTTLSDPIGRLGRTDSSDEHTITRLTTPDITIDIACPCCENAPPGAVCDR